MTLTEKKQKGWQRSMRLLIDANVILDVLQNREPHVKDSAAIWRLCETRQAEGFIGYTGALKAPVRCFGNHLSRKRKSLFRTDDEWGGAAILKNRTSRMGTPVGC